MDYTFFKIVYIFRISKLIRNDKYHNKGLIKIAQMLELKIEWTVNKDRLKSY